jgi:hypothetical protein
MQAATAASSSSAGLKGDRRLLGGRLAPVGVDPAGLYSIFEHGFSKVLRDMAQWRPGRA